MIAEVLGTIESEVVCAPPSSARGQTGDHHFAFGECTCEINTLGDPQAALFTFCVALTRQNTLSMLLGSRRAAHGAEAVESVSGEALAYELRNTHEGMRVAIEEEHWQTFSTMTLTQFAKTQLTLAQTIDLSRSQKSTRSPKQPAPKRTASHNGGHASTHKLLSKRPNRQEITKE